MTVTAERATDESVELHFHAGGQGYWVARMIRSLGEPVVLCLPLGGESGDVFRTLAAREGVELETVESGGATAAYVHDRRNGDRDPILESGYPSAGRHELDDLHGRVLTRAVRGGVCVLAGHPDPSDWWCDFYERIAKDLDGLGVRVVADLHHNLFGPALRGGVSVLKTSSDELGVTGRGTGEVEAAIEKLVEQGARDVVVTRAEEPTIAFWSGEWFLVEPPRLDVVDGRGGGDATTAALAVGVARGWSATDVLSLAAAAGAASVARRGLASAELEAIETLRPFARVERLESVSGG